MRGRYKALSRELSKKLVDLILAAMDTHPHMQQRDPRGPHSRQPDVASPVAATDSV